MASRPARGKKSDVSYAEVESDVDLSDSDRPSGESAAKTGASKRKKKAKRTPAPVEEKEVFSLEPFLNMPLDILAEICTHLFPTDLLSLARSARVFRSLLLSRSGRSIWAAARLAKELPLLKGMCEVQFAILMYGELCFGCGAPCGSGQRDLVLQTRRCKGCRKSVLVRLNNVAKMVAAPCHSSVLKCAISTPHGPSPSYYKHEYYVLGDLIALNDELWELQEYDDATEGRREAAKLKTGTKSRKRALPENLREDLVSRVDEFVEEKSRAVSERVEEIKELEIAIAKEAKRESTALNQQSALDEQLRQARQTSFVAKARIKMTSIGWEDDEVDLSATNALWSFRSTAPLTESEWSGIEAKVVKAFRREKSDRAQRLVREGENARRLLIGPYYNAFKVSYSHQLNFPFPSFQTFCRGAAVKPFWIDPDSTINNKSWALAEVAVLKELRATEKPLRQRAANFISTATGSPPPQIAALSVQAQNQFFARVTSLFVQSPRSPSLLLSFPNVLTYDHYYNAYGSLEGIQKSTRANSVLVFRAILEAAGLDDTATTRELDNLDARFRWRENHGKNGELRVFGWRALAIRILKKNYTKKNLAKPTITLFDPSLPGAGPDDSDDEDEELEDSDDGGGDDALLPGEGAAGDDSGSDGEMGGRNSISGDDEDEEGSDDE